MGSSHGSLLSERVPRLVVSTALAVAAALFLDAFYTYIEYGQNPTDLQQLRVHFWIAYTGIIALAAAIGSIYPRRHARVALLSVSAWGSLVSVVLGIFSIGLLYLIPFGLALTALGRIINKRLELAHPAAKGRLQLPVFHCA